MQSVGPCQHYKPRCHPADHVWVVIPVALAAIATVAIFFATRKHPGA